MDKIKELSTAAGGGEVINTNKAGGSGGDPLQQLNKILETVSQARIEAQFVDAAEKPILTRTYIEIVIGEFSEKAQNPQMSNKWIALDMKLEKALKEFKSELRILLAGQAQMGAAQATLQSEAPEEAPAPAPQPQQQTAADRALPTQEK